MYVRRHKRKKNGKEHTYWSLVESYRTAKGPRNRTVAYLGEMEESARKGWVNFSRAIDGKPLPEHALPLFPSGDDNSKQEVVPSSVQVKVGHVEVDQSLDFGDIWLATVLWRSLELDQLFVKLCPDGHEEIRWSHLFALLTFARFCEPSSELYICEQCRGQVPGRCRKGSGPSLGLGLFGLIKIYAKEDDGKLRIGDNTAQYGGPSWLFGQNYYGSPPPRQGQDPVGFFLLEGKKPLVQKSSEVVCQVRYPSE